jgi:5'-deoxynucleotidase YfbR-like HD superfamily hydrolase
MRASSVKRWHVVKTSHPQTVAEHSFNVAIIAAELMEKMYNKVPPAIELRVMKLALLHDIHEVHSGDIPMTAKPPKHYVFEDELTPEEIVKVADLIDNYCFIREYHVDRHGKEVAHSVYKEMMRMRDGLPSKWVTAFNTVVSRIVGGALHL